jgi:hypothetical protein
VNCSAGNEEWSGFRWLDNRNYLEKSGGRESIYSAAVFENGTRAIAAGLDGRVRDQSNVPLGGASGWGSDIAGAFVACGSNSIVLAAKAVERDAADAVSAYEVSGGTATSAGDALAVPGSITALWPAADRDRANLVVRNARTGSYEASSLRLACAD